MRGEAARELWNKREAAAPSTKAGKELLELAQAVAAHIGVPRVRVSVVIPDQSPTIGKHPPHLKRKRRRDLPTQDRAEHDVRDHQVERAVFGFDGASVGADEADLGMRNTCFLDSVGEQIDTEAQLRVGTLRAKPRQLAPRAAADIENTFPAQGEQVVLRKELDEGTSSLLDDRPKTEVASVAFRDFARLRGVRCVDATNPLLLTVGDDVVAPAFRSTIGRDVAILRVPMTIV